MNYINTQQFSTFIFIGRAHEGPASRAGISDNVHELQKPFRLT